MTPFNNYDGPFDPGFDVVITAVNPRARCLPKDPEALASGGVKPACAWECVRRIF